MLAEKDNVLILNNLRTSEYPNHCRVCNGDTYSYGLVFSKISASLAEKLYNINYSRAGNIFGKFHRDKACCHRICSRLSIKDFKMSKNDKQVYNRFNNFLRGTYSLQKEEPKEH